MKHFNEQWTAEVVGKLHYLDVTQKEFAYFMGVSPPYLSSVLHGKKKYESEYAKKMTQRRVENALKLLEYELNNEDI
jgi:transcriptional regulator with XRE-family HTH domain